MIITILRDKYNINSNRGITFLKEPDLLEKVNAIIDWDLCTFPIKSAETKEEDREFLGKTPKLDVGNMFIINGGQVCAFNDKDTLILCISESGLGALQRIYDEVIKIEYKLKKNYSGTTITFENSNSESIPENFEYYAVPYPVMSIFKNRFLKGRDEFGNCIKITMDSDSLIMPEDFYIKDWLLFYNPESIIKEQLEDLSSELIAWFYNNYKPIKIEQKDDDNDNTTDVGILDS